MVINQIALPNGGVSHPRNELELLDFYLSLVPGKRKHLFVTTATAAASFGISQRTLQRWIEAGSILSIRVGRKYQVYIPSVEQLIAKCSGVYIANNTMRHLS